MRFLNLQHTRSDGEIDTYYLKATRSYRIGRGSVCEIRILDMRMSRQHAAIKCDGEQWLVEDYGSTNGVRLNDQQISETSPLQVNDIISLGETRLRVDAITNQLSSKAPTVQPDFRRETQEDQDRAHTVPIKRRGDVLRATDSYLQGGEKRTIYITLLDQRVGPLTRSEARELKKREMRGELTQGDIADRLAL